LTLAVDYAIPLAESASEEGIIPYQNDVNSDEARVWVPIIVPEMEIPETVWILRVLGTGGDEAAQILDLAKQYKP
jgi:hypothetical protein